MIVVVTIAVTASVSTLLLFQSSALYPRSEIIVEKALLTATRSIIVLKNVGNTEITRISTVILNCDSGEYRIDSTSFAPQPIPGGGSSTAIISLSLRPGEACRLHVQAVSEAGEVLAYTSGKITVVPHL